MPQWRAQRPRGRVPEGAGIRRGREPRGRDDGLGSGRAAQRAGRELMTAPENAPTPAGLPSEAQVLEALKVVKDPEIPVNVVDLGLIYGVDIQESGLVDITMTLTSVGCPVQDLIRSDAELAVGRLDGVSEVNVEFVWTPPWGPDKMTEDGKRQMRMFGFNV
nr:metal-sulfur cluster assembly factor [Deinococcus sp. RM]